jgi:hypothetical protein
MEEYSVFLTVAQPLFGPPQIDSMAGMIFSSSVRMQTTTPKTASA